MSSHASTSDCVCVCVCLCACVRDCRSVREAKIKVCQGEAEIVNMLEYEAKNIVCVCVKLCACKCVCACWGGGSQLY